MKYINQFLDYKAAGDILNIAWPVKNCSKEISEAMGVIKHIKPIMLKEPEEWVLVDLCSGNALVPLISAFTLPSEWNYAVDIRPRERRWSDVRKFQYFETDIYKLLPSTLFTGSHKTRQLNDERTIITAVHACKKLAERVIKIFNESPAKHLILMPCCCGYGYKQNYCKTLQGRIGRDVLWTMHLMSQIKTSNKRMMIDNNILSPKNIIIAANK